MDISKSPQNLIVLLESIILMQMLVENLESLQGVHYDRQRIKQQIKSMLKLIEPLAERDYNTVFRNGESETQTIIFEYEKLIRYIAIFKLPTKVVLSQMVEAFDIDQKAMESTIHRIINKPKK